MCLVAHANSAKGPGGAGGKATYEMCIDVERDAAAAELLEVLRRCAASR